MSNPLHEYAIIRLSARVRGLLAGRLPTDSANCIVEAFSAAADGDVEKADDLITRAQTP